MKDPPLEDGSQNECMLMDAQIEPYKEECLLSIEQRSNNAAVKDS